jgi:hypothetical protein
VVTVGRPMILKEETGKCTSGTYRGRGPSIQRKTYRDKVGKVPLPAGADDNLQRPVDQGDNRRQSEGLGLAHESVGAMKAG